MQRSANTVQVIGFWHEYEDYGCFSNWYPAEFDYAHWHFLHVEQFMMYHKVMMFRQYDLADRIMKSTSPKECKDLGRTKFREFDSALWNRTCRTIAKRGVRAKFQQNQELLKTLLGTGNAVLAECSPYDQKWGVGVSTDDPNHCDVSRWNGQNLLGRILMEVRDELQQELALAPSEEQGFNAEYYETIIPEWNMTPGELKRIPQYFDTIHAYSETIEQSVRNAFYHNYTFDQIEDMMNTNMGGGLPAAGFFEMKWDIYDIARRLRLAEDQVHRRLEYRGH